MPRLWERTIAGHKVAIRDAILNAAEAQIFRSGMASMSMSALAASAGVGRATLYKYFPDLEAVLKAWHARQVDRHLEQLRGLASAKGSPPDRLLLLMTSFANLANRAAPNAHLNRLHEAPNIVAAEIEFAALLAEVIAKGQEDGTFRRDLSADDLACFAVGVALAAAKTEKPARTRIISLALATVSTPPVT